MDEIKPNNLASLLRDFAQGASNSVAGNVAVPVDAIAWLLRKGGVNVPSNPVMGSDWMAEKGLTREPQNKLAGLVGDMAGMVAPFAAAAKAPQIAKGLLSAGEAMPEFAASAGRPANYLPKRIDQTGAIVWHGSPHKFAPTPNNPLGEFDFSKIGTGEGAQAYGYGGYLGGAKATGEEYRRTTSLANGVVDSKYTYGGADIPSNQPDFQAAVRFLANDKGNVSRAKWNAKTVAEIQKKPDEWLQSVLSKIDSLDPKMAKVEDTAGYLYKVDLPDEHIAKMLDWDKPLSQQAPDVQSALNGIEKNFGEIPDFNLRKWMDADPLASTWHNVLQRDMGADPAMITNTLKERGIPGIKYLDGGSRGAGQGSSNYVVFPGNERLLKILERNGESVAPNFAYPQSEALKLAQQRAALPLPPAGVDITKLPMDEARQYGLGLRADNTAMERAIASKEADSIFDMNFPTDVYHGTNADINAFDPLLSDTRRKTGTPNGAIVSSTNPKTASTYAGEVTDDYGNIINYKDGGNVLPLRVNTGNGLSVNAKGSNWGDIFAPKYPDAETTNDIAQIALDKGKQSATIKKVLDNATWSKQNGVDSRIGDTIFSFNPDDIRSRFAAFDPWRRNAAIAAAMGVAAPDLLANPLDDKNNRLIDILGRK